MEVLIALFILGAFGAALLTALQTNAQATRTLDEKVQASNLAAAYLEEIRDTPYAHSYPNVGNTIPKPPQMKLLLTLTSAWLRAVLPSSPGWYTKSDNNASIEVKFESSVSSFQLGQGGEHWTRLNLV